MNYKCPKCGAGMYCNATASIPAYITYYCPSCKYVSKTIKENVYAQTLPKKFWDEQEEEK